MALQKIAQTGERMLSVGSTVENIGEKMSVISAGVTAVGTASAKMAVNFVSNSTRLVKAGFADAGAALDVLTTIMDVCGLEADKVTDVSDILIQTQNLGKTTVGGLSFSMGKNLPTANAYGGSLTSYAPGPPPT